MTQSGWFRAIEYYRMDAHGQMLKGEMNKYTLPKAAAIKSMLKKYKEVCFGGNYVTFDFEK